jgi:hypothetical protein
MWAAHVYWLHWEARPSCSIAESTWGTQTNAGASLLTLHWTCVHWSSASSEWVSWGCSFPDFKYISRNGRFTQVMP